MLASHELGVLTSLFPQKSPQTLKDVQKRCLYSYERIHSAIKSLDERGAIDLKRYGNVMVATPKYDSDLAFLAYLHYMVGLKAKMFDEHRAASLRGQSSPAGQKNLSRPPALDDILSCLYDISGIDADLVAVTEVSRTPRNKVAFFYIPRKGFEAGRMDTRTDSTLLSMRYKYPNIKIEPRLETEGGVMRKKEDKIYLSSVVLKGLENFYSIFYL